MQLQKPYWFEVPIYALDQSCCFPFLQLLKKALETKIPSWRMIQVQQHNLEILLGGRVYKFKHHWYLAGWHLPSIYNDVSLNAEWLGAYKSVSSDRCSKNPIATHQHFYCLHCFFTWCSLLARSCFFRTGYCLTLRSFGLGTLGFLKQRVRSPRIGR